jgi:hypothetical protein
MEASRSMNRTLLWITVAVGLVIALLFYRSRRTNLNVDPHARGEIEKAKRR